MKNSSYINCILCFAMTFFGMASRSAADEPVTFTKDVLPIMQENCLVCHRPGGANLGGMIAPMSFTTYPETRPWAKAIARAVSNRKMPPWDAAPVHNGEFIDERTLSDEEIKTIVTWVETGARRGNPSDAPPPFEFPNVDGWTIGEPDLILSMPEPFFVPDDLSDDTMYFPMELTEDQLHEDRWVKAFEFRPGSEAVHHVVLSPFGGISPGNDATIFREDYGSPLRKGQKVTWNLHYHKEAGPGTGVWDQSSIGIKFYPKGFVPKHRLSLARMGVMDFEIPAGAANHSSEIWHTFEEDVLIDKMMPHMHFRGKRALYELTYPDGTEELLLSVPEYDYNWQTEYRFREPKPVPAGTRVKFTGWWDNSADNPNNPDPTINVRYGERTDEEMLYGFVYYTNAK